MKLSDYRDYFKSNFGWSDSISIGKIDDNQEKAICFYNSSRGLNYIGTMGGIENSSTNIKPITILLKYTKNQDSAEEMAQEIFDFFNEKTFYIDEKRVFAQMIYNAPINLGTDDNNVYEYSIELNLYEERND